MADVELDEIVVDTPKPVEAPPLQGTAAEARRTVYARPYQAFDQFPDQSEYATLIVGSLRFQDWTSIWVSENWGDQFSSFRFTCADMVNLPTEPPWWELLQFKPGDECEIYLGRTRVMRGLILKRQVAYDANNHGVMLDGRSFSWWAVTSSSLDPESRFKGGLLEVAHKVLAPTGVGIETIGNIPSLPFKPDVSIEPGELIGQFLERISRTRNVIFSNHRNGNVLFIGDHTGPVIATLKEGVNILKLQCEISDEHIYRDILTRAQSRVSDDKMPKEAAEMEARATGTAKRYRAHLTAIEHPVWTLEEVKLRNKHEHMWTQGTQIVATITVHGWFAPNGQLWHAGDQVFVDSPMAMLKTVLILQTVTFTQDRQAGSLTTLLCVSPSALKGAPMYFNPTEQPMGGSTPDTGPAGRDN